MNSTLYDFWYWRQLIDPPSHLNLTPKKAVTAAQNAATEFAKLTEEQIATLCPHLDDLDVLLVGYDSEDNEIVEPTQELQIWMAITKFITEDRMCRIEGLAKDLQEEERKRMARAGWPKRVK
jgi:hypothetical protein